MKTNLTGYNKRSVSEARQRQLASMTDEEKRAIGDYNTRKELEDIADIESRLGFDLDEPKALHVAEQPTIGFNGTTAHSAFINPTIQPIFGSAENKSW